MVEITAARTNQDWQGYNGAYTIKRKRPMQVGLGYGVFSESRIKKKKSPLNMEDFLQALEINFIVSGTLVPGNWRFTTSQPKCISDRLLWPDCFRISTLQGGAGRLDDELPLIPTTAPRQLGAGAFPKTRTAPPCSPPSVRL